MNDPADAPPVLELRDIGKDFPGVRALDGVSFAIHEAEVHVLVGENGAGKSTLMKVLCGAYLPDQGEIRHRGAPARITGPADARALGVAVIFQEFSLVPYLDVAQNIYLGRAPRGRIPGSIDRAKLYANATALLAWIGFAIDPHALVQHLGVAQQQMVEIAKALSQDARILVMDEPTAALSDHEATLLFAAIARLKSRGVAIVYISHRMAEVFALADRLTVLRDGRVVRSMLPHEATPDSLVRLMVGRAVDTSYARQHRAPGALVLDVQGLGGPSGIADISLSVHEGEIVGLCGLVGSGRSEVARAIFGADPVSSGRVRVFGRIRAGGPEQSVRLGMALIPESRKAEGLALIRSLADNIVLAALPARFRRRPISPGAVRGLARDLVQRLAIAAASVQQAVATLSGGNQQKVVIGKWLAAKARLFIFDEPTRGIDVGAKAQIFALIDALVQDGAAVLMISSEQSEIVRVCDRAYVMRGKRIAGELARAELTEEAIVALAVAQ